MAFGSAAALIAILDELDAEAVVLGRDVSLELLRGWGGAATLVEVDVKDRAAVAVALTGLQLDAALVVANQSNLPVYRDARLPTFFVDLLFWYGAHKDEATWSAFVRGFAVDFPGVRARVAALGWSNPPAIVGPLLRPVPAPRDERRGTLVNLGGVRSVFQRPAEVPRGLRLIAHILHEVAAELPHPVTVVTGVEAASVLRPLLPASMRVATLSPASYDDHLGRAALFLTVPGLNAVLEAMAGGVPLAFLPALNASQCFQLACYEQAGVAAPGLALPDDDGTWHRPTAILDEGAVTRRVLATLSALPAGFAAAAVAHLRRGLEDAPRSVAARRRFVEGLGRPGAPDIARAITAWWERG